MSINSAISEISEYLYSIRMTVAAIVAILSICVIVVVLLVRFDSELVDDQDDI